MSRWSFLFKDLSYSPMNRFYSFHTWRESAHPTFSNSLAYFTRHWYERFTEDWKDADPDIPELIEARERLGELQAEEVATR